MAVAVRVLNGVAPLRPGVLLADPATWTILFAGLGGFYLFTVALQLGSVNGAAAGLVVGETVVPGITGVTLLGDTAQRGLGLAGCDGVRQRGDGCGGHRHVRGCRPRA